MRIESVWGLCFRVKGFLRLPCALQMLSVSFEQCRKARGRRLKEIAERWRCSHKLFKSQSISSMVGNALRVKVIMHNRQSIFHV